MLVNKQTKINHTQQTKSIWMLTNNTFTKIVLNGKRLLKLTGQKTEFVTKDSINRLSYSRAGQ